MGWWRTDIGNDVIGDGPLDTLMAAMSKVAAIYLQLYGRKPSLSEILRDVTVTLRKQPENYLLGKQDLSMSKLVAKFEPNATVVADSEVNIVDEAVIANFHDAFEVIAVEYEDSEMARKPKLSEILVALQMVLSYQPTTYLSNLDGLTIREISED
jgi:hypothetical protein